MSRHQTDARAVEPLLDARRAAEVLAISPRKLWELTNRADIPHVRIGRSVRYDSGDLRTWIERNKRGKVRTTPRA